MALLHRYIYSPRWMQRAALDAQAHWRTANLAPEVDVRFVFRSRLDSASTLVTKHCLTRPTSVVSRTYCSSSNSVESEESCALVNSISSTAQQPPAKPLRVERLLANLGYGKRQECTAMIRKRRLVYATTGIHAKVGEKAHAGDLLLDGEVLDPPTPLTIILHKPVGYVVTSPDDENVSDPKVYDLLPYRFGRRRPFLSSIGCLDKETSGLLLLTDDGQLLHSIQSPVRGIWKVYIAELASPLEGQEAAAAVRRFASGGLQLQGDRTPLLPAVLRLLGPTRAEVCICEGRYHQIRRMFAALGHQVTGLHRAAVGGLRLAAGQGNTAPASSERGAVSHDSSSANGKSSLESVVDVFLVDGEWRRATAAEIAAVLAGPDRQDNIQQQQEGHTNEKVLPGERQQHGQKRQQKQGHHQQQQQQQPWSNTLMQHRAAGKGAPASSSMGSSSSSNDSLQHMQVLSNEDAAWYAAASVGSRSSAGASFPAEGAASDEVEVTADQQVAARRYRDSSKWARKRAAVARGLQDMGGNQRAGAQ